MSPQANFGSENSHVTHITTEPPQNSPGSRGTEDEDLAPGALAQRKPIRLSLACNQCRKRKVRCDAQHPKCHNCSLRGDACETSDPRRPGNSHAVRRRATRCWQTTSRDGPGEQATSALDLLSTVAGSGVFVQNTPGNSVHDHVDPRAPGKRGEVSRANAGLPSSTRSPTSPLNTSNGAKTGQENISWLSRAYQESTVANSQKTGEEHNSPQQSAVVTPDVIVNTDGTENRIKVSV